MSPAVMHCNAPRQVANRSASSSRSRDVVRSELLGVWNEHGQQFVAFTLGAGSTVAQCKPADLRSFARFRRLVMAERGVLVDHDSAYLPRHVDQRAAWASAVREAVTRGAAW